jgi:hypothetical protein
MGHPWRGRSERGGCSLARVLKACEAAEAGKAEAAVLKMKAGLQGLTCKRLVSVTHLPSPHTPPSPGLEQFP